MRVYAVFFEGAMWSACYGIYSTYEKADEVAKNIRTCSTRVKRVWINNFILDA